MNFQIRLVKIFSILLACLFVLFLFQLLFYVVPMADDLGFIIYLKKYGVIGSINFLREQITFRFSGAFFLNLFFLLHLKGFSLPTLLIGHYLTIFGSFIIGSILLMKTLEVTSEKGILNKSFMISIPVNILAGYFFFAPHANELFFWINSLFFYLTPICFFTLALGILFTAKNQLTAYLFIIPLLVYCGGVSEIVVAVFGVILLFLLWKCKAEKNIKNRLSFSILLIAISGMINITGSGFFNRIAYEREKVSALPSSNHLHSETLSEFVLGMFDNRQLLAFIFLIPFSVIVFKKLNKGSVINGMLISICAVLISFAFMYVVVNDYGYYRYYAPSLFVLWISLCLFGALLFNSIHGKWKYNLALIILVVGVLQSIVYFQDKVEMAKSFHEKNYLRERILITLKERNNQKAVSVEALPDPGVLISAEISADTLFTNNYYLKEYLGLPFQVYLHQPKK